MKLVTSMVLALGLAASPSWAQDEEFDEKAWSKDFRAKASAFVESLGAEQQKAVTLDFDDKARWEIRFPGGERPGIRVGSLSDKQKGALRQVGLMLLSEAGMEAVDAITAQGPGGGIDRLWVTVFGDPRKGDFAIRVAEHHLTIVNVEVKEGLPAEVGPILIGSNPPVLFAKEEKALLSAWQTLSEQEQKRAKGRGKGVSGQPLGEKEGAALAELSEEAQEAIGKAGLVRAELLSPALQHRIRRAFDEAGGKDAARVAFYFDKDKEPTKRCVDGGRWDFKFGIPGKMIWDYQGNSGHIHMSLWAK